MIKEAVVSDCGNYRYYLKRTWDDKKPKLVFLMVNPSTADARKDDPTIHKCIKIAMYHGYGAIIVINLFAYRTSKAKDLIKVVDPLGKESDRYFYEVMKEANHIVLAWGNSVKVLAHMGYKREAYVYKQLSQQWGRFKETKIFCLGKTMGGEPKHPLFFKNTQRLIPVKISKRIVRIGPPLETTLTWEIDKEKLKRNDIE